jgi:hypothetical protein
VEQVAGLEAALANAAAATTGHTNQQQRIQVCSAPLYIVWSGFKAACSNNAAPSSPSSAPLRHHQS